MVLIYLSTIQIYNHLAEYLTELEMWRTQTQFDDSLTLKIYLLQFVNYYASIFYIAFFKGKFVGHPGKYITVFQNRQEEVSDTICFNTLLKLICFFFEVFFGWLSDRALYSIGYYNDWKTGL